MSECSANNYNLYSLYSFPLCRYTINKTEGDSAGPGRRPAQLNWRRGWNGSCPVMEVCLEGRYIPPVVVVAHLYTATKIRFIYSRKGIAPGSVHIFSCSRISTPVVKYINRSQTHECGNWYWGRAILFLEIFVSNFRYCVFAECALLSVSANFFV